MNTAVAKPISHKQLELPKYIELKYHLQKEILEKKRQAHDLLPTESELSNAYHLSPETIRKALQVLEEEGVIYRIPRRGTFVSPDVRRQQLLIVIQDPFHQNPFDSWHMDFLSGIMEGIKELHSGILPIFLDEKTFLHSLPDLDLVFRELSGVVFFCRYQAFLSSVETLKQKQVPNLFFGSDENKPGLFENHSLMYSEKELTHCALEYLYDSGVRHFSIFYSKSHPVHCQRYEIFLSWLKAKNLDITADRICGVLENVEISDPSQHRALLKSYLPVFSKNKSGVFCPSDIFAMYLINEALRSGYHIPKDFRVIGIDDLTSGKMAIVPLTTVKLELAEGGKRCLELFAELHRGRRDPIREIGHISLIKRESA